MRVVALVLALVLAAWWTGPARAAFGNTPVAARANALIPLLNGKGVAAEQFAPSFLTEVPEAKLRAITGQLRATLGLAVGIASVTPEGPDAATVVFAYKRGAATMRIVVSPAAPHLITGLLITNSRLEDDSFAKLDADFAALPGKAGFAVARLGGAAPVQLAGRNADRALAIGSAFKLYVLAELVREIDEGRRKWSDVVPLTARSLPSGILQDWPAGAPMTLHTLAALMISRSDNSAADTLIALLGRERVEAMQALAGHSRPARNMPFLTTGEMFLLKGTGGKAMRERWIAGDLAARRAVLVDLTRIDRARFDYGSFTGLPVAIGAIEWFASPDDIVRVLDWIRTHDDGAARAILAINPGIGAGAAADYFYLGFKGGSETGVVNLSFLVQAKSGAWMAVSGSWNDPNAAVDENRFVGLMARAVALGAK